jgi:hypothetical protein
MVPGNGAFTNLAASSQSGSLAATAGAQSSNVPSATADSNDGTSNAGSYLNLDF